MGVEPVEFTPQEREVLRSLARTMGQPVDMSPEMIEDEGWDERTRKIVREEMASAFGLILRRTREDEAQLSRSPDRNTTDEMIRGRLAHIFGELLKEYGGG